MVSAPTVLVAAKILVLLLGSTIAGVAFLGYRRSGDRFMLALTLGFALIAFGSFVEGLLFEVLGWDLSRVHMVESVFVLLGLGTLVLLLRPPGVRP